MIDLYISPSSSPRSTIFEDFRLAKSFANGRFFSEGFNMNHVDLPSKVILDAMFEKVGLPVATYSARAVHRVCLEVTVAFHPIANEMERPVSQTYISTSAFTDLEEAQNHVRVKPWNSCRRNTMWSQVIITITNFSLLGLIMSHCISVGKKRIAILNN